MENTLDHAWSSSRLLVSPGAALRACLILVVALTAWACAGSPAADDSLKRVKEAGVLRWGADVQGGAPYIYEDPDHPDKLRGFEVDLAEALAAELGVKAEFVQNDWSALIPSLERGTFDIAMNGVEVTPARVGRVLFTRPYYVFASRMMARRDDESIVGDLDKLKGKRIGTLTNSYTADQLLAKGIEPVYYEGTDEPYQDLVAGRIDAVFHDDIIAGIYGEPRPQLRVVGDFADGFYSIATPKTDQTLRDAVDARWLRRHALLLVLELERRGTEVEHVDDAGVADGAADPRLVEEALEGDGVVGDLREHDLDGHVAIDGLVPRGPDGAHPTAAEEAEEPVTAGEDLTGGEHESRAFIGPRNAFAVKAGRKRERLDVTRAERDRPRGGRDRCPPS